MEQNTSEVNLSYISPSNMTISDTEDGNLLVTTILDRSQLVMVIVGFGANIATLITLTKHVESFGVTIAWLLRHQAFLDATVSLCALILLVSPFNWIPHIDGLNEFICNVWNSQAFYWQTIFISSYNLVLVAYERFLCVCRPFVFQETTVKKWYGLAGFIYLISFACNCGSYFQTRMKDGECHSEYFWDGPSAEAFFSGFAISVIFTFYLIPCGFFVGFYGMVIKSFRERQKSQNLGASGESRVIQTATNELTKTAIVVTIIFVLSFSYDYLYYLIGYLGFAEYVLNTPIQKVGVLLSVFNSSANPFVYAILMPRYRKAVKDTFFTKCRKST